MSKSKSLQQQLLAPAPREPKKQPPVSTDKFHINLIRAGQQISPDILIQQAESLFDQQHGGEIRMLELKQIELDVRYKASTARLEELEKQLRDTDEFITTHSQEEPDYE